MEKSVTNGRLDDMSTVARNSSSLARRNYAELKNCLSDFDLLIQDEFVETLFCFMWDKHPTLPPLRVTITDYLELRFGAEFESAKQDSNLVR